MYMSKTPLSHRMVTLMTCAFGFCACYALGLMTVLIFITPTTIFLAEAAHLGMGSPDALLVSRLIDTVLGSVLGLIGGICLHSPLFRDKLGRQLRRLAPARLLP
jgi:hypothetical protein